VEHRPWKEKRGDLERRGREWGGTCGGGKKGGILTEIIKPGTSILRNLLRVGSFRGVPDQKEGKISRGQDPSTGR